MGSISVIGSYIVALVMDSPRIPVAGETLTGSNYHVTHGGKGSNMACAAARLGGRTAFLGKVGDDDFGRGFLDLLRREGVDASGVLLSDRLPTAVGFIIAAADGMNLIVIDPGANGDFSPADVAAATAHIASSKVIVSPLEIPLETALAGARLAKPLGVRSILNPAPACDLRECDLSAVTVLTPNETEARVCLGLSPRQDVPEAWLARALLDLGPDNVVITLGERGALWACRDGLNRLPALRVPVVDTVGAGDAFNAGLATGMSEDMPLARALALAVSAASLSTRKRETIDSYPSRAEADRRAGEVLAGLQPC